MKGLLFVSLVFLLFYLGLPPFISGQVFQLTTDPNEDQLPSMVIDDSGRIWVFWQSNRDGNWNLYSIYYDGISWSSLTQIAYSLTDDIYPDVAVNGRGEIWVAWQNDTTYLAKFYSSGNWSDSMIIHQFAFPFPLSGFPEVSGSLFQNDIWVSWGDIGSGGFPGFSLFAKKYDGIQWQDSVEVLMGEHDPLMYEVDYFGPYGIVLDFFGSIWILAYDHWWSNPGIGYDIVCGFNNGSSWNLRIVDSGYWMDWGEVYWPSLSPKDIGSDNSGQSYVVYTSSYSDTLEQWDRLIVKSYNNITGVQMGEWIISTFDTSFPVTAALSENSISSIGLAWSNQQNLFVQKYNGIRWSSIEQITFTGTDTAEVNPAVVVDDSGYVWVAWQSNQDGNNDIFVTHTNPPIGVEESDLSDNSNGMRYKLFQNHPNPFLSSTQISYTMSILSQVSLKIYDVSGRFVKTLVEGKKVPGHYTILWDGRDDLGNDVVSGVYFYHLKAGEFVDTKRLIFIR